MSKTEREAFWREFEQTRLGRGGEPVTPDSVSSELSGIMRKAFVR
jgi:hypothetical protein